MSELDRRPNDVADAIRQYGLAIETIQRSPSFHRSVVDDGTERVVIDLVADPTPSIEPATTGELNGVAVALATPHDILVAKLCAMLGRTELRDAIDVQALLAAGGNLDRAIADAATVDTGFSAAVLAWVLSSWPMSTLTGVANLEGASAKALEAFVADLAAKLAASAHPGTDRSRDSNFQDNEDSNPRHPLDETAAHRVGPAASSGGEHRLCPALSS